MPAETREAVVGDALDTIVDAPQEALRRTRRLVKRGEILRDADAQMRGDSGAQKAGADHGAGRSGSALMIVSASALIDCRARRASGPPSMRTP